MANYGTLKARAYDFPLPQGDPTAQVQSPLGQGQAPGQGEFAEAPSGLQYHRDVTKNVYDNFYQLKSFVSSMWKNYGIDVTNPDFTNEFSMKANQLYQESVANMKFTMDRLQNSQKMLSADAAKGNMRLAEGYDVAGNFYDENVGKGFTQMDLPEDTKEILKKFQVAHNDTDSQALAQEQIDAHRAELESRLKTAQENKDYATIDQTTRAINALKVAMYDPSNDRAVQARNYATSQRGQQVKTTDLWDLWNQTKSGDFSYLEGLQGPNGQLLNDVTYVADENAIYADVIVGTGKNAKPQSIKINLNDITGGFADLVQTFDPNFKGITRDDLLGNNPKIKVGSKEEDVRPYVNPKAKESMYALAEAAADPSNESHQIAIDRINSVAKNGVLKWPGGEVKSADGSEALDFPRGARILRIPNTRYKFQPNSDPNTFFVVIDTSKGEKKAKISLKENPDIFKKIVTFNNLTGNDEFQMFSNPDGEQGSNLSKEEQDLLNQYLQ